MTNINSRLTKLLSWNMWLITLFVTPLWSYDAVNIPRFLVLSIFGTIFVILIIINVRQVMTRIDAPLAIFLSGFLLWGLTSSLNSDLRASDWLFGLSNRNNGFLSQLFLVSLMVVSITVGSKYNNINFLKILGFTGFISMIYGVIQYNGLDPFLWINSNSPVFGFWGNPNFQSAFMGATATGVFALLLDKKFQILPRIALFAFLPLAMFVILKSKSVQGFLVLALGISVVFFLWLRGNSKNNKITLIYAILVFMGIVATALDILQKVPWTSFLYKESVSYRGDFWRAGWKMTIENPFFGVGFGGYVDNFRKFRDLVSASRSGSSNVDSAHNALLDISSSGGFPLLISYVGIIMIVLFSALKVIRRNKVFDIGFAGVFGCWVAFTAQSLISVGQLGLSAWGWVLGGAIIGYEKSYMRLEILETKKNDAAQALSKSGGIVIGLILVLPLVNSDIQFRSSVRSGDVNKILLVVQSWPQNIQNMNYISSLFRQQGFNEQSLLITRAAIKLNPNRFESWQELYLSLNATDYERIMALKRMKEIDPYNPNFASP